jgi:hypothetical protein
VFSAENQSQTLRFQRKGGVKLIVVGKNVELICALLAVTAYSEKKQSYVFLANMRSDRGIHKNPTMYQDLTLN